MIFFFYGPNSFASRRKVQEMTATYLKKTGSDLGLERIEGSAVNARPLKAALQAVPFLSTSRLVIVEYLSANKKAADEIEFIVSDVPETTVVVFYEKEVDKRTKLYKVLLQQAKAQDFAMLDTPALVSWCVSLAKKLGGTLDRPAAVELVNRVGDDQWRLEQELMKLVSYHADIAKTDVIDMVEQPRDDNIFDLIEAVAAGRTKQALERYHDILATGASEMYVLSMITWQLRNLLLAKMAGPMPPSQLAKEAGISPYVAQKAAARHTAFTEHQLRQAFLLAIDTEFKIKTGAASPEELVELLIYDVSAVRDR